MTKNTQNTYGAIATAEPVVEEESQHHLVSKLGHDAIQRVLLLDFFLYACSYCYKPYLLRIMIRMDGIGNEFLYQTITTLFINSLFLPLLYFFNNKIII